MSFELAQLNIASMLEPLESPLLSDFVANLNRINSLAEQSPGFIWRLQSEAGDATTLRPFGDSILVNMSIWTDIASLHHFVYKSTHVEIMRRRKAWFERMREAYTVLWWVPKGHRPTIAEASERLDALRANGATTYAFTFRHPFPSPDSQIHEAGPGFDDVCPA